MLVVLNDRNLDEELGRLKEAPLLVDCWSPRAEYCRYNAPVVDEISRGGSGGPMVGKLNVDENPFAAARFAVRIVPSLLLFLEGRLVGRLSGACNRSAVEKFLREYGVETV